MIEIDCLGTCGGTAELDECGECNGQGIAKEHVIVMVMYLIVKIFVEEMLLLMSVESAMAVVQTSYVKMAHSHAMKTIVIISMDLDLPADNLYLSGNDLFYNSINDIGGFQFEVVGANILDVFGGTASDAGLPYHQAHQ